MRLLSAALTEVQAELDRRTDRLATDLSAADRLMVELELAIDDVADQKLRAVLHRLVHELDSNQRAHRSQLFQLGSHDLWDPLKIFIADFREERGQGPIQE